MIAEPLYTIHPVQNLDFWQAPVLKALGELQRKTDGRYSPEQIFDTVNRNDIFALWVVVETGEKGLLDSVVGVLTLDLWVDECYQPFTFISRVWGKSGVWARNLLQLVMPKIEYWAKERTPKGQKPRLMAMAGRTSRHREGREHVAELSERIGKQMGWTRRETIFEKELTA